MKSLRADMASDLHNLDAKVDETRKEVPSGPSVCAARRVGQHLNLSPSEAHCRDAEVVENADSDRFFGGNSRLLPKNRLERRTPVGVCTL
jgi:hypothetical protein